MIFFCAFFCICKIFLSLTPKKWTRKSGQVCLSVLLATAAKEGWVAAAITGSIDQMETKAQSEVITEIWGLSRRTRTGLRPPLNAAGARAEPQRDPQVGAGGLSRGWSGLPEPVGALRPGQVGVDSPAHNTCLGNLSFRRCPVGLNSHPVLLCRQWTSLLVF